MAHQDFERYALEKPMEVDISPRWISLLEVDPEIRTVV